MTKQERALRKELRALLVGNMRFQTMRIDKNKRIHIRRWSITDKRLSAVIGEIARRLK